jgi:hypothetical protein
MKPKKAKKVRRSTPKQKAERYGLLTVQSIVFGKWFGPAGEQRALVDMPSESIGMLARRAAHEAITHRERYPLKERV